MSVISSSQSCRFAGLASTYNFQRVEFGINPDLEDVAVIAATVVAIQPLQPLDSGIASIERVQSGTRAVREILCGIGIIGALSGKRHVEGSMAWRDGTAPRWAARSWTIVASVAMRPREGGDGDPTVPPGATFDLISCHGPATRVRHMVPDAANYDGGKGKQASQPASQPTC